MPRVTLTVGRSTVLTTDFDITRVAITNPAVADVTVVDARELLIDGKGAGHGQPDHLGPAAHRVQYDVVVDPGVSPLQRQIQTLFPGEDITANETADAVILTGHASNNVVMLRAGEIAQAIMPKAKVINMLQLPGGNGSQQVMLQVRVAEVNRTASAELGASLFTGGTGYKDVIARTTTQQFPAPGFENLRAEYIDGKLVSSEGENTFSDFLNLFVFSNRLGIGVLIKALETRGHLQSLAEPNLIAYNGQEASFLAGGELPIPVVQGNSGQRLCRIQGIRRPPELHAHHCGRRDSAESQSRKSARSTLRTASRSGASGCRRSSRAAPRPTSSCATGSPSRSPDC